LEFISVETRDIHAKDWFKHQVWNIQEHIPNNLLLTIEFHEGHGYCAAMVPALQTRFWLQFNLHYQRWAVPSLSKKELAD